MFQLFIRSLASSTTCRRPRRERGAISVEMAIIVVGMALIALVVVAAITEAVEIKIGGLEL